MRSPKLPHFPLSILAAREVDKSPMASAFESMSAGFKAAKESITSSGHPELSRETWRLRVKTTLREGTAAAMKPTAARFRVVLLQEGLGNLRDAHYYSREAIESAVPVYEGKKCYANHPSQSEEEDRPERSVRDIVGHFENLSVGDDEGRAQLEGDLVVLPGSGAAWARHQIEEAIAFREKFPKEHLVGLSINASGDSDPIDIDDFLASGIPKVCVPKVEEAKEAGVEQVKVVRKIFDARSCDLVTDPGAGGGILDIL